MKSPLKLATQISHPLMFRMNIPNLLVFRVKILVIKLPETICVLEIQKVDVVVGFHVARIRYFCLVPEIQSLLVPCTASVPRESLVTR